MDHNNPDPQPSTSAQAKENDKKTNQDQESKPSKKPKNDESNANVESVSPVLAVVAAAGSSTGNKLRLIYGLDYVVQQLGKYGSKEELKMLRSLSNDYYEKLNPIYWDKNPHRMKFRLHVKYGFPDIQILNMDNDHQSVKYFEELPEFPFDNRPREIEKIVHTFRALIIEMVRWADLDKTQLKLITLISPHIKYLKLELDEADTFMGSKTLTPQELVKIMEQFTNLKSCKIEYSNKLREHFEMILRHFSSSNKFEMSLHFNVGSDIPPIFEQLGDIPNVRWTVHMSDYAMLEEIRTIHGPLFRLWPELDINFDIWFWISNLDELRTTAQFCLDYNDKINKLDLTLNIMNISNQDEEVVKTCLGVLRSFVTHLGLYCETKDWNIDIDDETWSWPKLTELNLNVRFDNSGGNIPFVIMKNSPNLQHCYLRGTGTRDARSLIIFQNQEYILEYFGGLTKLRKLRVSSGLRGENKDSFEAFLKQHLPGLEIQVW